MSRKPTILRHVSVLYRYSQMHLNRVLRPLGAGQYPFLLAVHRRPGISQDELSDDLAIDKGTTARAVRALERGGYLLRSVDGLDRRILRLTVTDTGKDFVAALDRLLREWTDVLSAGFSAEERDLAYALVERMAGNARSYLAVRCAGHTGRPSPVKAASPA